MLVGFDMDLKFSVGFHKFVSLRSVSNVSELLNRIGCVGDQLSDENFVLLQSKISQKIVIDEKRVVSLPSTKISPQCRAAALFLL